MAECLVTKLKSVVNDKNLLKLGELRVKAYGAIAIESYSNPTTLTCISGTFEDGTTEKTVIGYKSFDVTNPSVVSIIPKYNLSSIGGWNGLDVNLKDLSACSNLINLQVSAIAGSFKDINEYSNAHNIISLQITIASGFENSNIEDLTNLKNVNTLAIMKSNTSTSLVQLTLTNLPTIFPKITSLTLSNINIIGSINDLVLPSTCTKVVMTGIPATLTGSKATFLSKNPQVTVTDFRWSSGITE